MATTAEERHTQKIGFPLNDLILSQEKMAILSFSNSLCQISDVFRLIHPNSKIKLAIIITENEFWRNHAIFTPRFIVGMFCWSGNHDTTKSHSRLTLVSDIDTADTEDTDTDTDTDITDTDTDTQPSSENPNAGECDDNIDNDGDGKHRL